MSLNENTNSASILEQQTITLFGDNEQNFNYIRSAILDTGIKVLSLYDFINYINGRKLNDKYATNWYMKKLSKLSKPKSSEEYVSDNLVFNYKKYQFPGERQKQTPVCSIIEARKLLSKLGGKINRALQEKMTKILTKYLEGSDELIQKIKDNKKRTYEENHDIFLNKVIKKSRIYEDSIEDKIKYKEFEVRDELFNSIPGSKKEVKCETGIIDILTPTEIIEVKHVTKYKHAFGQIFSYSKSYPNHQKRIHLYYIEDNISTNNDKIYKIPDCFLELCANMNVIITYHTTNKDISDQNYIVVMRRNKNDYEYDSHNSIDQETPKLVNEYLRGDVDIFKHYIIRSQSNDLELLLFIFDDVYFGQTSIICKQPDPKFLITNDVLSMQPFVHKSHDNYFCIKDEGALQKFILNYKDSAL